MNSLGEQLPREIARVRDEVLPAYLEIGLPGQFAVMMMRKALDNASEAMISGDVVAIIQAYEDLKGYNV